MNNDDLNSMRAFYQGPTKSSTPFGDQKIYSPNPRDWGMPQRSEINRLDQEVRDRSASAYRDLAGAAGAGIAGAGSFAAGQPIGVAGGFGGAVALTGIALNDYQAANKAQNEMNKLLIEEKQQFYDKLKK